MLEVVLFALVVAAGLGIFVRNLAIRLRVLRAARSTDRRRGILARIGGVIVHVFGQGRLLHGDLSAGIMHFLIFWGFVVLLVNSVQVIASGFLPGFEFPLLGDRHSWAGHFYLQLRDIFTFLVLLAVSYAFIRRTLVRPRRLTLSSEGLLILGLIGVLMVTDILMAATGVHVRFFRDLLAFSPVESFGYQHGVHLLTWLGLAAKWTNLLAFMAFLNLLPLSKHFHVLLSPFNVFLRDLEPFAKPTPMDLENSEEFGVSRIEQLHWKNWLDAYNCTECGRCDHFCPANQTGKVLSPQHIITGTRDAIYAHTPHLLVQIAKQRMAGRNGNGGTDALVRDSVAGAQANEMTGEGVAPVQFPELVGEIHVDAALWACTTCGACDLHCPVFIEHVNPIMEMRRHLVLEQDGRYPKELNSLFRGLEGQSNPWGLPMHTRMDWAAGLNVPTLADNPDAEYLYYVGCFGSFDAKSKPTTVAMIELLNQAGVNYAVIGKSEGCNGDPARRCGHEYLAQTLAEQLVETFREMTPRKVITQCPHCFNSFKVDYPDFGFSFDEVIHHSELLARLVADGRLKPTAEVAALGGAPKRKVVFHDSCYLGRYNGVYDAPRETLKSIPGVELVEAKPCKDKGFCCGAGGGRMFMEETEGRRVNEFRYEQLEGSGADEVAVACPYCMTMIDDAASTAEHKLPVRDIALVLRDALRGEEAKA